MALIKAVAMAELLTGGVVVTTLAMVAARLCGWVVTTHQAQRAQPPAWGAKQHHRDTRLSSGRPAGRVQQISTAWCRTRAWENHRRHRHHHHRHPRITSPPAGPMTGALEVVAVVVWLVPAVLAVLVALAALQVGAPTTGTSGTHFCTRFERRACRPTERSKPGHCWVKSGNHS
jgi:hypothetical protein